MVLLQRRQETGTLVGQVGGCDEETDVCGHFMGWNLGEGAARHILAFEIGCIFAGQQKNLRMEYCSLVVEPPSR